MLELLIAILIIGVVLYLVETYVPMSPPILILFRLVAVLLILFWLLRALNIRF